MSAPRSVPPILSDFGWNTRVPDFEGRDLRPARVTRVDRSLVTLITEAGTLRLPSTGWELTTGDWVGLEPFTPSIAALAPRWSLLERAAPDRSSASQLLAANVDIALLTVGLDRDLNLRRLHRLLAIAWASGAQPVVALTKADVAGLTAPLEATVSRSAVGVEVVPVSVVDGRGLTRLRGLIARGVTAVLLGESGAGKSSVVNALAGATVQVGAVREGDHKGRHTTRARELVPIADGGVLLDTPGIRGVGLSGGEAAAVTQTFADVEILARGCRFRDCRHDTEPGCAVRSAVEEGIVDEERLTSFHDLRAELASAARRASQREDRVHGRRSGRDFKQVQEHKQRTRENG